jgi:hypothetical protein
VLEGRATAQPSPEQGARIAALEQRVAQLGATPAPDPAMPTDWAARIEALERRVTLAQAATPAAPGAAPGAGAPTAPAQEDRGAAMERTLGSVEESLTRISGALAALERRIAAIETASSRGTADQAAIAALRAEIERLAGDLTRANMAAQQTGAAAAQQSSAAAGLVTQRAAFTRLRDAIARGAPFESELGALRTAGADAAVTALGPIAAAAPRGIPTLPILTSSFRAVADAIVRADRPADTPWWWLPFERMRAMVLRASGRRCRRRRVGRDRGARRGAACERRPRVGAARARGPARRRRSRGGVLAQRRRLARPGRHDPCQGRRGARQP